MCAVVWLTTIYSKSSNSQPLLLDFVPNAERAKVLRFLSTSAEKNLGAIKTWCGKYETSTQILCPLSGIKAGNPILEIPAENGILSESGVVEFSLDLVDSRIFTSRKMEAPVYTYDNGEGAQTVDITKATYVPERQFDQSIVTSEHYLSFRPLKHYNQLEEFFPAPLDPDVFPHRMAFRQSVSDVPRFQSSYVDPRHFFGHQLQTYSRLFETLATALEGGLSDSDFNAVDQNLSISMRKEGDATVFQVEMAYEIKGMDATPDSKKAVQTTLHSSAVGFNVLDFKLTSPKTGKLHTAKQYEYREVDGLFVPSFVQEKILDVETGEPIRVSTFKLIDVVINEPIDPSTFAFAKFEMKDGERIYDRIENKLFLYRDGKLVDPGDSLYQKPDLSVAPWYRRWLLWLNIAIAFVFLLWVTRRRFRRDELPPGTGTNSP